jgi:hypothetical protein
MRLPRLRFTVKTMMVAVAVVAMVAGLARIGYRWWRFRESYLTNAAYERSWRHLVSRVGWVSVACDAQPTFESVGCADCVG